jgi:phosphatidylglycerol:prolipoprotein diacylglycerol transferase
VPLTTDPEGAHGSGHPVSKRGCLFPVTFTFGAVTVQPHVVFEALAYTLAFALYRRQRRRAGDVVASRTRIWVILASIVGGLAGSRLLYLLEQPALTWAHRADLTYLAGGKTIVGGLIGGLIAVEWTKRRLGERRATGDLFALPLVVGIAVGRVGCFLSGLADRSYGVATTLPWGVDFGDGVSRHPTQLYEIAWLTVLGVLLCAAASSRRAHGDLFKIFMAGYLSWRLCVEFLKPHVALAGLSAIQWACLATLVYYTPHLLRIASFRPEPAAEPVVPAMNGGRP